MLFKPGDVVTTKWDIEFGHITYNKEGLKPSIRYTVNEVNERGGLTVFGVGIPPGREVYWFSPDLFNMYIPAPAPKKRVKINLK